MSKVYHGCEELIGRTPLLALDRVKKKYNLKADILAKLEAFNPAGSVKDRVAKAMLDEAEKQGLLKPGSVIIEPTSGNTGIGLAALAAVRGYKLIIVMPDTMSAERRRLMKAYGAELFLTEGRLGMQGSVNKAKELAAAFPGAFIPDQFNNPANADIHYRTTGPELWEDADGRIDVFAAGVGTGGTLTGVGRFLKEKNPDIKIAAVEPAGSPVLSRKISGKHAIQGIGAGFVPSVLDTRIYDEVIAVGDAEALETGRMLGRVEGFLAGISSGAALWAAIRLAEREENEGKRIAVVLPDTGERYLSSAMFV